MCTFKLIAVSDYGLYRKFGGNGTLEEYAEFLAKLAAPGKEYLPRREANERGTDVPVRKANGRGKNVPVGKANGRGKNVPVGKANGKCADASVQEKFPKRPDMLIVREKNLPEEAYLELFGRIWNLLETIKGPSALLIPHTHLPTAHKTGCFFRQIFLPYN